MKFITEDDLRKIWDDKSLTVYTPEKGTRLTPGASQFLADRGITFYTNETKSFPIIREALTKEVCCPGVNPRNRVRSKVNGEAVKRAISDLQVAFCAAETQMGASAAEIQTVHELHDMVNALASMVLQVLQDTEDSYGC